MANKNTSDSIEAYIKAILAQAGMAELKRSELADVFQVVPSQINYVIKTRFTESRGYVVESKRGGGGYIRIGKVQFSDHHQMLQDLAARKYRLDELFNSTVRKYRSSPATSRSL